MNAKDLFKAISKRMSADFEASAQVLHNGSKGTVRENILREFLGQRLPKKFGLGSGEVVGRIKETSNQCDLIIYDAIDGLALISDISSQVYPVDCLYGIIEVKSKLSKAELTDCLDKIAKFKSMASGGAISSPAGGGMLWSYPRPRPFGAVFAFDLAGNSLDSLVENLKEWQKDRPPSEWPNYICILGRGIIEYCARGSFDKALHSEKIVDGCWPSSLSFKEDSLFRFYCAIHDLCINMKLGPVELMQYFEPATRIGRFIVEGKVDLRRSSDGATIRLSEPALQKVVTRCASAPTITYGEALIKQLGAIPQGMKPSTLEMKVRLYNPDNLPGLAELGADPFVIDEAGPRTRVPSIISTYNIVVDGEHYMISMQGFTDEDFEVISQSN
jgi:hypothetical protein